MSKSCTASEPSLVGRPILHINGATPWRICLFTGPCGAYNNRAIHRRFPAFQAGKDKTVLAGLINLILLILGVFLILLVLIQRGKGGGLAGAFGGVGGSSPFGSRAGDAFTRITIYIACFWLLLTMVQVRVIQSSAREVQPGFFGTAQR
jgi:preprotein translocase subunit SecG